MLCTPKAEAICGFSSMLTLARTTWPSVSSTTFSMIGPSVRHGPHHGAQRSTTTGTCCDRSMTSAWKVASVTSSAMASRLTTGSAPATARLTPPARSTGVAAGYPPAMAPEVAGIDIPKVTAWLEAHVAGARGPFGFEQIAGGHSNLTYRVDAADGQRFVLRRPPLGHVLPSAHDMGREHRIIAALAPTPVPVAPALGYCDDPAVNGASFYVMGYVDGLVLRDAAAVPSFPLGGPAAGLVPGGAPAVRRHLAPAARAPIPGQLVDTLAPTPPVDLGAGGLADPGPHDSYVPRQLKRWYGQWGSSKTR